MNNWHLSTLPNATLVLTDPSGVKRGHYADLQSLARHLGWAISDVERLKSDVDRLDQDKRHLLDGLEELDRRLCWRNIGTSAGYVLDGSQWSTCGPIKEMFKRMRESRDDGPHAETP